ncbi:MAG: YceI family protein [Steroidobacteraceae bacterium]
MTSRCKMRVLGVLLPACWLTAGCPTQPRPALRPTQPLAGAPVIAPHLGRPYDIVSGSSLLTVRVYRGGALASAGHNHVIASHALSGTIYVPAERLGTSFEVRIPAAELTVDEPALRSQAGAGFPPDVSESARAGTRRNMLGPALLDAADFPELVLTAERLEPVPGGEPGEVLAHIRTEVRGAVRSITLRVRYRLSGAELTVSADGPLTQSELGLTPFTALLGALAVQDEMQISIRLTARAAGNTAEGAR